MGLGKFSPTLSFFYICQWKYCYVDKVEDKRYAKRRSTFIIVFPVKDLTTSTSLNRVDLVDEEHKLPCLPLYNMCREKGGNKGHFRFPLLCVRLYRLRLPNKLLIKCRLLKSPLRIYCLCLIIFQPFANVSLCLTVFQPFTNVSLCLTVFQPFKNKSVCLIIFQPFKNISVCLIIFQPFKNISVCLCLTIFYPFKNTPVCLTISYPFKNISAQKFSVPNLKKIGLKELEKICVFFFF